MVLRTRSYPYRNSSKCFNNIDNQCTSKLCSNIIERFVSYSLIFIIFVNFIWVSHIDTAAAVSHEVVQNEHDERKALDVPKVKSIYNFGKVCENFTTNFNGTAFFHLNESVVKEMHFDNCQEIHPIFLLSQLQLQDPSTDFLTFTINMTNNKFAKTLNVSRYLNCSDVKSTFQKVKIINVNYCNLQDILERNTVCSAEDIDLDVHINCTSCKVAYREWLCLKHFGYDMNGQPSQPCKNVSDNVCRNCPAIDHIASYGGYSIFQCEDDVEGRRNNNKVLEHDNDGSCVGEQSVPCSSFRCLNTPFAVGNSLNGSQLSQQRNQTRAKCEPNL